MQIEYYSIRIDSLATFLRLTFAHANPAEWKQNANNAIERTMCIENKSRIMHAR